MEYSFTESPGPGSGAEDEKTREEFQRKLQRSKVCRCECGGLLKPNIVFYGEELPVKFFNNVDKACPARSKIAEYSARNILE